MSCTNTFQSTMFGTNCALPPAAGTKGGVSVCTSYVYTNPDLLAAKNGQGTSSCLGTQELWSQMRLYRGCLQDWVLSLALESTCPGSESQVCLQVTAHLEELAGSE